MVVGASRLGEYDVVGKDCSIHVKELRGLRKDNTDDMPKVKVGNDRDELVSDSRES